MLYRLLAVNWLPASKSQSQLWTALAMLCTGYLVLSQSLEVQFIKQACEIYEHVCACKTITHSAKEQTGLHFGNIDFNLQCCKLIEANDH